MDAKTPPLVAKGDKIVIKLSRPLEHGDDEIFELALRPPTVEDIADIGYPFTVATDDGETRIELKPKAILKYASRLAAVPPSVLKTMAISDFMNVQTEIMGFFGGLAETPPT
mgnify:CR=1 FL=1